MSGLGKLEINGHKINLKGGGCGWGGGYFYKDISFLINSIFILQHS